jgi:FKBP-type peptidyl-prolyl cis-trans isomerase
MIAKSKKLQKILGKTDIQNGPDRNPFLIEYSYLAKLKRSLDKMRQQNVDDKIKLDDFNEELREAEEQTVKESIAFKIKEINDRMLERVRKITQTQQDFNLKEQEHKSKNVKTESDMKGILRKYLMLVRN